MLNPQKPQQKKKTEKSINSILYSQTKKHEIRYKKKWVQLFNSKINPENVPKHYFL